MVIFYYYQLKRKIKAYFVVPGRCVNTNKKIKGKKDSYIIFSLFPGEFKKHK